MTDVELFTHNPQVAAAINDVNQQCGGRVFSDIIDDDGYQYVDLVMEGGGLLGIALTGYTYVLEQAGIRFLGVGGTSAGAINALMIAALGTPAEAKSAKLVNVLARMPTASFIDGDSDAQEFSRAAVEKAGMVKLLWKALQVVDNLKEDLGLNPGQAFFQWLTGELHSNGIGSNSDLQKKLSTIPKGLRPRPEVAGKPLTEAESRGRLIMVAADITTESKIEFPKMAELYWSNPDEVNPACFARASMSIPFFFHPYRIDNCPQNTGEAW